MAVLQTNKSYFITPEYLFEVYPGYLDLNIDTNSINTFILKAQWQNTQAELGHDLYYKYINDISSGAINQPANINYYNLLVNFIMDEVALYTIFHMMDWLQNRNTNKGMVNKYSQWSKSVTPDQLDRQKFIVLQDAQYQDARIISEILTNTNQFPEYSTQTGVNRIYAKPNPYDNWFQTGNSRRGNIGFSNVTTSEWEAGYGRCCD